jgi:hypothetical protein
LLAGVAPIASVDFKTDLAKLGEAMAAGRARVPVLLVNPLRLAAVSADAPTAALIAQGRLGVFQLAPSYGIPPATVVACDANSFAGAIGDPQIVAGRSPVVTMASADSTAPTQSVDNTGKVAVAGQVGEGLGISVAGGPSGAGTTGYEGVTTFQTRAIALQCVVPISWNMMRSGCVAGITDAAW